jgi:hypothetical protein
MSGSTIQLAKALLTIYTWIRASAVALLLLAANAARLQNHSTYFTANKLIRMIKGDQNSFSFRIRACLAHTTVRCVGALSLVCCSNIIN